MAYLALDVPHKGQASYIHIHEIVENLRKLGWNVELFIPPVGEKAEPRPLLWRVRNYARVLSAAIRALGGHEVLYVRAHPLAWPVAFAARRKGVIVAQEINGVPTDIVVSYPCMRPLRSVLQWLYYSQFRAADYLFAVTEELAQWARERAGHDRVAMISNAANVDVFRPLAETATLPKVVFFGGLTAWHGVELMMAAALHEDWPSDIKLVVIGAGAEQHRIQAAQRAGAPIEWLGYQPNERIPELIAGAIGSLVTVTNPAGRSSTGVLPLKLYESLACGLPVIATDLPGQAQLVREGRCGIVIAQDAGELARAVGYLSSSRAEAAEMGRRGTALISESHSWHARAKEISAILDGLLSKRDHRTSDTATRIS